MKYQQEFRDPSTAKALLKAIDEAVTQPWRIMEVCGGQTHSIMQYGIDTLLPAEIQLIHGPGCPVCVTPQSMIDEAIHLALAHHAIVCSYGDMLRVPGTQQSLLQARAAGGDVRIIYSPNDALDIAVAEPNRQVVFFAIGFETTSAVNAMAAIKARTLRLTNFSLLVSQVTVPAAIDMIAGQPDCKVDGFLAAGHVCTVMGDAQYPRIAEAHHVPIVITGFEPVDVLLGILRCVEQLEGGKAQVENAYSRSVKPLGNPQAKAFIEQVFDVADKEWRGIGVIPKSGWVLNSTYRDLDAAQRFECHAHDSDTILAAGDAPDLICKAGQVLLGTIKPPQCSAFGTTCTPDNPLGAPMVSLEGACHAYYLYHHA